MEWVFPATFFAVLWVLWAHLRAWEAAAKPSEIRRGVHSLPELEPDPDPDLPDYIKKPSQVPALREWQQAFNTLAQKNCHYHFGTTYCKNCGAHNPDAHHCSCETVTQITAAGEICALIVTQPDPHCYYHVKEKYFANDNDA